MTARFKRGDLVAKFIESDGFNICLSLPKVFIGKVTSAKETVDFARCLKSYIYTVTHKSGSRQHYWEQDLMPLSEVKNRLISILEDELAEYIQN
tara:strand:- start:37964 stop:38245 length:282 start_codon:yes stop_codon:yes gene_type:complete